MSETNKYKPPEETGLDYGHAVARSGLGAIPFAGTAAIEIFNRIITPPIEDRRDKWRQLVGDRLQKLDEEGTIDLEKLTTNEGFATIVLQATLTAIRSHQKQKLRALHNAVINSAVGIEIREDFQLILIRYIDELVPSHLTLLEFFNENQRELGHLRSYEELYQEVVKAKVDVISRDEFKLLCGDLSIRGLVRISRDIDDFKDVYEGPGLLAIESPRDDLPILKATELGRELLKYIAHNDFETA